MLKFALVGCGRIAKRHSELLGLGQIKGAELVAACDLVEEKAKKIAKESTLKPAEERSLVEKFRAEELTERERLALDMGVSNFEFHYLGSAKILGGIGEGFAKAMKSFTRP